MILLLIISLLLYPSLVSPQGMTLPTKGPWYQRRPHTTSPLSVRETLLPKAKTQVARFSDLKQASKEIRLTTQWEKTGALKGCGNLPPSEAQMAIQNFVEGLRQEEGEEGIRKFYCGLLRVLRVEWETEIPRAPGVPEGTPEVYHYRNALAACIPRDHADSCAQWLSRWPWEGDLLLYSHAFAASLRDQGYRCESRQGCPEVMRTLVMHLDEEVFKTQKRGFLDRIRKFMK